MVNFEAEEFYQHKIQNQKKNKKRDFFYPSNTFYLKGNEPEESLIKYEKSF